MQLSKEQKEIIERAGAALSKPSEAAKLAGIAFDTFKEELENPDSEIYVAYFSGYENTKLELKESTIAIALQGSSPAQTLAFSMLHDSELEMDSE